MKDSLIQEGYAGKIFGSIVSSVNRIMIGIPLTGNVRAEWMLARYGQVIPCNWSQVDCIRFLDQWSPMGFSVADARNVIATAFVEQGFEWLFFIDHDTILDKEMLNILYGWCGSHIGNESYTQFVTESIDKKYSINTEQNTYSAGGLYNYTKYNLREREG